MKRVIIIGGNGSGKTTFAYELAKKTNLPLIHTDSIYWRDNWKSVSRTEFDGIMRAELKKEEWIIDGNNIRSISERLKVCDTVFFFDLPVRTCLWGITKRIFQNRGKTRDDMGGNCPEHFDAQKRSLYRNVLRFNREHRKDYYDLLKYTQAKVIVFKSRCQARKFLERIKET